jgi:hypothetical protein
MPNYVDHMVLRKKIMYLPPPLPTNILKMFKIRLSLLNFDMKGAFGN